MGDKNVIAFFDAVSKEYLLTGGTLENVTRFGKSNAAIILVSIVKSKLVLNSGHASPLG